MVSVSILGAELIVRLTAPQQLVRPYVVIDEFMGAVGLPGANYLDQYGLPYYKYVVKLNDFGLRMNQEIVQNKKHVVLIGDSMTFGWGVDVDESYAQIISENMANVSNDYQYLNAGWPGAGLPVNYIRLKELCEKIDVSHIVYFIGAHNLIESSKRGIMAPFDYEIDKNRQARFAQKKVYTPFKRLLYRHTPYHWLNQNSHLFIYFKSRLKSTSEMINNDMSPHADVEAGYVGDSKYRLTLDISVGYLRLINDLLKKKQIKLLVIWGFPSEDRGDRIKYFESLQNDISNHQDIRDMSVEFYNSLKQRQLSEGHPFLNSSHIKYFDGHYTPLGNKIFAKRVLPEIKKFIYPEPKSR
jgi:hypothetical protein